MFQGHSLDNHPFLFNRPICNRLVVLESGLKSIFAELELVLGFWNICNQVHFQFSLCTSMICSVFMPYDILLTRIVHTTKDLRYLLTIYCGINSLTCLLTVACSAACSSSVNKGRHTAVYIVLSFATGTYCKIRTWTRT